jgi:hypothetical protein
MIYEKSFVTNSQIATVFIGISFGMAMSSSQHPQDELRRHALHVIEEKSNAMGISHAQNALQKGWSVNMSNRLPRIVDPISPETRTGMTPVKRRTLHSRKMV